MAAMDAKALADLCQQLIERAAKAGADQAEAIAGSQRNVDTRLENNDVHTVQTTDETVFGLRVFVGGSLGFVTSNRSDPDTLDECVSEALAQAAAMPADPLNDLPPGGTLESIDGLYDEATAAITVAETTELAAELVERVRARDERIRIDSGGVSATTWIGALASSKGVLAVETGTAANGHLFGMAVDGDEVASFDYDGDAAHSFAEMRGLLGNAVDRFADKCLSGLGAQSGRSFKGSVVLSPDVVDEFILGNLVGAMCADSVRKGRSPLADKVGSKIAVAGFTLIDDGTRAGGMSSSTFDREGTPIRRRVLIEDGVLQTYLYNHYEARAAGNDASSTGHAGGGASSLPSISPVQLELAAGDTAASDLFGGEEPIIHVGRFSGSTNPVTGDFSGVVKNGFLVENGERQPIKETLMAGNLFTLLESISAISKERRTLGGSEILPTIRAEGVSITAG
jgi:PmbA protein